MNSVPASLTNFSSLQLELLKLYAFEPSEEQLLDIKNLLGWYFLDAAMDKVDEAVETKNISEHDLDAYVNRTDQ